jgi:hypothetical protein
MKDRRVVVFRSALDGLFESLGSVVRIAGWVGPEELPEPIRTAASSLVSRLGSANRLASGKFSGSSTDTVQVTAMSSAITRLDGAYVAYRRRLESEADAREAAIELGAAIEEVRLSASSWGG